MNRATGFLLALIAAFGVLSLLLVLPYVQWVLLAVLIAYVFHPLVGPLERQTSSMVTALTLTSLAVVVVLLPFVVMGAVILDDAMRLVDGIDPDAFEVTEVEARLEERLGIEVDLTTQLVTAAQEGGTMALERATDAFGILTHVLIGIGVTIFLVYYLLKDGDALVEWMRSRTPLPEDVQDDLISAVDDVMGAVLVGHVLIAFIEGLIAGLGLFATGIPNAAFWTVVMMILALVPLVGAFLVWGPAVVYLLLTGDPVLAAGLFVYSAVVVGICDDYLRPILVDRYADISPAVIIVGVVGGVSAFGLMGLFFGPVLLGAFLATVDVLDEHWDHLEGETAG